MPERSQSAASHPANDSALSNAETVLPATPQVARSEEFRQETASESAASGLPEIDTGNIPAELADHPRYRVLKRIGSGGMGNVYLAEHRVMLRQVAIKTVHPSLIVNEQAAERFQREIRAAAMLSHGNIVSAFDAERAGQLHFLAMEYVEGADLARLLQENGPLTLAKACHYTRQAALGLQHAFEKGMVHRDIKPHNLILTGKNQIKILDFGLARLAREHAQGQVEGLTGAGAYMGTADYIAPEQASDASKADIRADIYSLGCTLYQCLTGQPPFAGGTAIDKIVRHVNKEPTTVESLRPEMPVELADIVRKMMAKNPEDRFQQPGEVAKALEPLIRLFTTRPGASSGELPLLKRVVARDAETAPPFAAIDSPVAPLAATAAAAYAPLRRLSPKDRQRTRLSPRHWWMAGAVALMAALVIALALNPMRESTKTEAQSTSDARPEPAVAAAGLGKLDVVQLPVARPKEPPITNTPPAAKSISNYKSDRSRNQKLGQRKAVVSSTIPSSTGRKIQVNPVTFLAAADEPTMASWVQLCRNTKIPIARLQSSSLKGKPVFSAFARDDDQPGSGEADFGIDESEAANRFAEMLGKGFRLVNVAGWDAGGKPKFALLWKKTAKPLQADFRLAATRDELIGMNLKQGGDLALQALQHYSLAGSPRCIVYAVRRGGGNFRWFASYSIEDLMIDLERRRKDHPSDVLWDISACNVNGQVNFLCEFLNAPKQSDWFVEPNLEGDELEPSLRRNIDMGNTLHSMTAFTLDDATRHLLVWIRKAEPKPVAAKAASKTPNNNKPKATSQKKRKKKR